jgi:hypothetical protein
MRSDERTTPDRLLAPPGSPEAHAQGCTCPDPGDALEGARRELEIDENCPVHGAAAIAWERDSERGPLDTEGDIVDAPGPEPRRNR